jgi:pilus assembly protein Flp/PilA
LDAIRTKRRRLLADDKGATAIEYGLICALIVIAMIAGLKSLGGGSGGMWSVVSQKVQDSSAPSS